MTSERVLFWSRQRARAQPGSRAVLEGTSAMFFLFNRKESKWARRETENRGFSSYRDPVSEREALQRVSVSHPVLDVALPERRRHAGRAAVRARFGTRQTEPQLSLRIRTGAAPWQHRREIPFRHLALCSAL